jgi:hypothetical protein
MHPRQRTYYDAGTGAMPQPWLSQAHRAAVAKAHNNAHPRVAPTLSASDQRALVEDYLAPVVARSTSLIDEPKITELLLQLEDGELRQLLASGDKLQDAIHRMWTLSKNMVGTAPHCPEPEEPCAELEHELQHAFESALLGSVPGERGDGRLLLGGRQIGDIGGRAVGQTLLTFQRTLYRNYTMPLAKIQLNFCALTADGIAHLASAIRGGLHDLSELDLSSNPRLGDRGIQLLAWAIDPWCGGGLRESLQELHVRGTGCGNVGLSALLKSVAHSNSTLVTLSAGDNPITAKGFWALGE